MLEGTARRWSMPWDTAWMGEGPSGQIRPLTQVKLSVPSGAPGGSQERSRSTTPGNNLV